MAQASGRRRRCGALLALLLAAAAAPPAAAGDGAAPSAAPASLFGGHFALLGPDGAMVTERSFPGRWLVIYFGYTFCPDACPTTLNALAQALDALGPAAAAVEPLFITIDPARDTPEVMARYVALFDRRILGLTGTPEAVAAAARAFRVSYAPRPLAGGAYAMDHSAFLYVVDPAGRVVLLLGGDVPGHRIAEALGRLLR